MFTSSKIAIARVCQIAAALALALLASGCAETAVYRSQVRGYGPERYSAWFADERDGVIYFGLSPFWTELRARGAPTGDLAEPSAHLIGRFELGRGGFLPMLVARRPGPDSRSSVWDVLAHPNGWVYYTTYFEEMGRVRPATGEVEHFDALGTGLNEIALGPDGNLYVTRYGGAEPRSPAARDGALVELAPDGRLLREVPLHARDGAFTAPKSVAVDPLSGEVWLNADVIAPDGTVAYATFRLGSDLAVRETLAAPELMFAAFDRGGLGIFVEDDAGAVRARLVRGGRELARVALGPRVPTDFAQDVHFAADGTAAIAFWSGRIELVRESSAKGWDATPVQLEKPADCADGAIFYSAFAEPTGVYATLYCDAAIVRAPLP